MGSQDPRMQIVFILFLSCVAASNSKVSKWNCPESGWFDEGDIVEAVNGLDTWQKCGQVCGLLNSCKFWSYRHTGYICEMYSQDWGLRSDPDWVSGDKGCQ